jgi:hypothetical protein
VQQERSKQGLEEPLGQNKSELVLVVVVVEEEQNIPELELLGLVQNTLVPWERGPNKLVQELEEAGEGLSRLEQLEQSMLVLGPSEVVVEEVVSTPEQLELNKSELVPSVVVVEAERLELSTSVPWERARSKWGLGPSEAAVVPRGRTAEGPWERSWELVRAVAGGPGVGPAQTEQGHRMVHHIGPRPEKRGPTKVRVAAF